MTWISVHKGVNGPKLRRLAKKLDTSKAEALGILNFLWFWGTDNADKTGKFLDADVDDICEAFTGVTDIPVEVIVEALFSTGWIDDVEGVPYLHDWDTWQEQWYKALEKREKDAERKRESRKKAASILKGETTEEPETHKEPEHEEQPAQAIEEPKPKPPEEKPEEPKYSKDFEEFWEAYPRKIGKGEAYKKYKSRRKDGFSETELLTAARNYAIQCKRQHTDQQYIKHPKTFLSDNTPFVDYIPKETKTETPQEPDRRNPFAHFTED